MTDVSTNEPLRVSRGLTTAAIRVSEPQLPAVRAVLDRQPTEYWTSVGAISDNGGPRFLWVEFGTGVNADQIQALLDAAA